MNQSDTADDLNSNPKVAHGNESRPLPRVLFSFVVDTGPSFAWQGYHLAKSILQHCAPQLHAIHVHLTPEVSSNTRAVFESLGCVVSTIERFGDGKYCNKIAQLAHLPSDGYDIALLLDTDTILTSDTTHYLSFDTIQAKVVDVPNPSLLALQEIAHLAGMQSLPETVATDAGPGNTLRGNCNGGFYSIPRNLIPILRREWPRWAQWLQEHSEPLRREGKLAHIDQVSMWLSLSMNKLPYSAAPSNLNYFVHFDGEHSYFDPNLPICLIHYHDRMNVVGLIEPAAALPPPAAHAVTQANRQIAANFENRIFWDFRYRNHPERGSGFGSRGAPLVYKRALLRAEGLEQAQSVLDIGFGDLEVLRGFNLKNYCGFDRSEAALEIAKQRRPDWIFRLFEQSGVEQIPEAEFVLCLEVLIHQTTAADYFRLIDLLSSRTTRKLIVSGYNANHPAISENHMTYYYEPLAVSLARTHRFRRIEEIGAHTSVRIYRCVV